MIAGAELCLCYNWLQILIHFCDIRGLVVTIGCRGPVFLCLCFKWLQIWNFSVIAGPRWQLLAGPDTRPQPKLGSCQFQDDHHHEHHDNHHLLLKIIVMVMVIILVIILCDPCENFDKVETKFEKRLLSALPGSRPPLDQWDHQVHWQSFIRWWSW